MSEENSLIAAFEGLSEAQQCQVREIAKVYLQPQDDTKDAGNLLNDPRVVEVMGMIIAYQHSAADIDRFYNHLAATPGGEKMKQCDLGF